MSERIKNLPMNTISYTTISSTYIVPLIKEVNEMIARGWEPLGGVCFGNNEFFQAMVFKGYLNDPVEIL